MRRWTRPIPHRGPHRGDVGGELTRQRARGRLEAGFSFALCQVARVLERFAWDIVLFSTSEFGLIRLPASLKTGSSVMPQKQNPDLAELLRKLGPWGQHFPEPVFEGRFVIEEKRVVGGAHLKMTVRPVAGHGSIDAIAFGRLPEDLPDTGTSRFVYKLDINHFRGRKTCQLMVEQIL